MPLSLLNASFYVYISGKSKGKGKEEVDDQLLEITLLTITNSFVSVSTEPILSDLVDHLTMEPNGNVDLKKNTPNSGRIISSRVSQQKSKRILI